jgi:N-acetylneuraminic acid mutarotase
VLIAGGNDNKSLTALNTAELFDPVNNSFTATGSMSDGRSEHAATLLKNGEVLVVGGVSDVDSDLHVNSAELYDPKTGTFSKTGNLVVSYRFAFTATGLENGKALIVGGDSSSELYDPNTGAFTKTGNMNNDRSFHTATLLSNGDVLVVGGSGNLSSQLDTAEIYDPMTGIWRIAPSIRDARAEHTATRLSDGRVLITGGTNRYFRQILAKNSAELFTPAISDIYLPWVPINRSAPDDQVISKH